MQRGDTVLHIASRDVDEEATAARILFAAHGADLNRLNEVSACDWKSEILPCRWQRLSRLELYCFLICLLCAVRCRPRWNCMDFDCPNYRMGRVPFILPLNTEKI